jgi:hypothetical protein
MGLLKFLSPFLFLFCFTFSSCEKEPGEGGLASIQGKVYILEYNGNCSELRFEYYAVDEDVYIIAGDDPSYFERVRTGPDGTFWFPYLREGRYTIYALSEDCSLNPETSEVEMIMQNSPEAIQIEVEISEKKQELILDDIIVYR